MLPPLPAPRFSGAAIYNMAKMNPMSFEVKDCQSEVAKRVAAMAPAELAAWLRNELRLPQHADTALQHRVDGEQLLQFIGRSMLAGPGTRVLTAIPTLVPGMPRGPDAHSARDILSAGRSEQGCDGCVWRVGQLARGRAS